MDVFSTKVGHIRGWSEFMNACRSCIVKNCTSNKIFPEHNREVTNGMQPFECLQTNSLAQNLPVIVPLQRSIAHQPENLTTTNHNSNGKKRINWKTQSPPITTHQTAEDLTVPFTYYFGRKGWSKPKIKQATTSSWSNLRSCLQFRLIAKSSWKAPFGANLSMQDRLQTQRLHNETRKDCSSSSAAAFRFKPLLPEFSPSLLLLSLTVTIGGKALASTSTMQRAKRKTCHKKLSMVWFGINCQQTSQVQHCTQSTGPFHWSLVGKLHSSRWKETATKIEKSTFDPHVRWVRSILPTHGIKLENSAINAPKIGHVRLDLGLKTLPLGTHYRNHKKKKQRPILNSQVPSNQGSLCHLFGQMAQTSSIFWGQG